MRDADAGCGMWDAGWRTPTPRTPDPGLRTPNPGLRTADPGPRPPDRRRQAVGGSSTEYSVFPERSINFAVNARVRALIVSVPKN